VHVVVEDDQDVSQHVTNPPTRIKGTGSARVVEYQPVPVPALTLTRTGCGLTNP
jgi:hypothetical protein